MTAEAQLLAVKDFGEYSLSRSQPRADYCTGMVFEYINNAVVWAEFCATFEAIYSDMEAFDTWFAATIVTQIQTDLATEWSNFIRATLDSMVVRSRILYNTLYQIRT